MKKVILVLSAMFLSYALTAQDDDLSLGGDNDPAEAVNEAYENLQGYMDWLEERRNEWNTVQNFSPGECSPDFNASSGAMMNSTCANNAACSECYEKAVGELNFIRRQLGRLSCIYSNTKNFNESALAFGDNMSGIHAVTGIAWQNERGGIIAEFNHFKQTYDSKYTDMMGALQRALQGIGTCEQQYGLPDWYQRFGFIYFEFMKDKYKRTD
ncbi:MAG: hypothetical protein IPI78_01790 [Chitinophagaceae bacterium]|nr:hypothetical protein [Chitinophagaceae bacterium]